MKRIVGIVMMVMACSMSRAQINEKDTLASTVVAKNGSVHFQADVLPDYVNLQWTKGPHDFIGYFELYRSADGIAYNIIRQFHPQSFEGNDNSYTFRDEAPLRGKNFYRLVGYDRFTNERRTVELVAEFRNEPRKLHPSVVAKGQQLYVNHYDGQELHLWIYNTGGTPVVQQRLVNSSTVNLPETLAGGAYVYQLVDKRKLVVSSGKFILQ